MSTAQARASSDLQTDIAEVSILVNFLFSRKCIHLFQQAKALLREKDSLLRSGEERERELERHLAEMKVEKNSPTHLRFPTQNTSFLKKRPKSTSFARISPRPLRPRGRRRRPPPRRSPPPRPPSSGGGCRTWRRRGGGRRSGGRCVEKLYSGKS